MQLICWLCTHFAAKRRGDSDDEALAGEEISLDDADSVSLIGTSNHTTTATTHLILLDRILLYAILGERNTRSGKLRPLNRFVPGHQAVSSCSCLCLTYAGLVQEEESIRSQKSTRASPLKGSKEAEGQDKKEDEDNEAADDEVDVGAKEEVARVLQRSILSFMPSGSKSGDAKRRKETTQAELVKTRTSPRKKAKTQS